MLERLFAELQRSGYGSYLAPPASSPGSPAVPAPSAPSALLPVLDAEELDRRIQIAVTAALAARDLQGLGTAGPG
jgi:hypothetical protein